MNSLRSLVRYTLPFGLILALWSPLPVSAQSVFADVNGDGVPDEIYQAQTFQFTVSVGASTGCYYNLNSLWLWFYAYSRENMNVYFAASGYCPTSYVQMVVQIFAEPGYTYRVIADYNGGSTPPDLIGRSGTDYTGNGILYIGQPFMPVPIANNLRYWVVRLGQPAYRDEQILIPDFLWQEFVSNEDGSDPHWVDRVTPAHWIVVNLPTARSAAPGPWTLEAMATNPLGYYNANPVQFLGMLPDWNWKPLAAGGDWDDWSMPDKASFDFALMAQTAADVARPWPTSIPKPDSIRAAGIVLVLTCVLELTKNLDFSYIVYEKVHINDPTHSYFGRSAGRGSPEEVRRRRDSNHERNIDHFSSRLRASVETRGLSDYAEWAVRGREQQMIDSIGGLLSDGGRATNFIRGVSKINPVGYSFWLTSNHAFGQIHVFTGFSWLQAGVVLPETTPYSTVFLKRTYP